MEASSAPQHNSGIHSERLCHPQDVVSNVLIAIISKQQERNRDQVQGKYLYIFKKMTWKLHT